MAVHYLYIFSVFKQTVQGSNERETHTQRQTDRERERGKERERDDIYLN